MWLSWAWVSGYSWDRGRVRLGLRLELGSVLDLGCEQNCFHLGLRLEQDRVVCPSPHAPLPLASPRSSHFSRRGPSQPLSVSMGLWFHSGSDPGSGWGHRKDWVGADINRMRAESIR